jgi:hypothetical protein
VTGETDESPVEEVRHEDDAPAAHDDGSGDWEARRPRPWIERIGLAGIALLFAVLFGATAVAAWSGGEPFLAAMGAVGCLMTVWVGLLTIVRG